MADGVTVKIDDALLRELIAQSPERVDKAIRETALSVLSVAVQNVYSMDAVDTGATGNSGFAQTSKGKVDERGNAFDPGRASGLRPDAELVDGTPGKPDLMTAYVSFATNYAIWIELGRNGGKVPAKPFLRSAVEGADKYFEKAIKRAFPDG